MSSNELVRQMRLDGLGRREEHPVGRVLDGGGVGFALAIINHLERLPW